jgi:hypothetical protein
MPELDWDNKDIQGYRAAVPKQDRRNHPALVPAGSYPKLTGIDGRHLGSFRRFPGFKEVVDLANVDLYIPVTRLGASFSTISKLEEGGIDTDTDLGFASISQVYFFKYITVQVVVGLNDLTFEPYAESKVHTLRGFVVAHDYVDESATPDQTVGIVRFVFFHPVANQWWSVPLLQEKARVAGTVDSRYGIDTEHANYTNDGPVITADAEYDVTAMGPFIFLCVNRVPAVGKPDRVVEGTPLSPSGSVPRDYYNLSIRFESTYNTSANIGVYYTDIGPLMDPLLVSTHPVEVVTDGVLHKDFSVRRAIRTFSKLKNVEGPLLSIGADQIATGTDATHLYWLKKGTNNALDDTVETRGFHRLTDVGVEDDKLGPALRAYRSIDSYWFENAGVDAGTLLGGTLFRENEVALENRGEDPAVNETSEDGGSYGTEIATEYTGYRISAGKVTDGAISSAQRINPYVDDTAYAPRHMRLLLGYQGTLLRIGSMPRAAAPAVTADREEILSWGSLRKYAPEQCRVQDATPLGSQQDERILTLVSAGDFAYAVGDTSVYRLHRNGQVLTMNEVQTDIGGVGRYAALGVGTALFYVSYTGVYMVDGATQSIELISALDRIILEDWKDSLDSIHMCYDGRIGALFILNETEDEALVIWSNTGLITTLSDVPFKFCTQGVNPVTAKSRRSFWMTQGGKIFEINATRDSATAMTMCGGDPDSTWNGEVRFANKTTNVHVPADGVPDEAAIGFKVHFLTGEHAGESRTITEIDDTAENKFYRWAVPLDPGPAVGDRYAIAPVPFEVVGWPLQDAGEGVNLFRRRIITGMGHSLLRLGGEITDADNPNLVMDHLIYRRGQIDTVMAEGEAKMEEDPGHNFTDVNYAGPVLLPSWRQMASNLDFELLGTQVKSRVSVSDHESDPST